MVQVEALTVDPSFREIVKDTQRCLHALISKLGSCEGLDATAAKTTATATVPLATPTLEKRPASAEVFPRPPGGPSPKRPSATIRSAGTSDPRAMDAPSEAAESRWEDILGGVLDGADEVHKKEYDEALAKCACLTARMELLAKDLCRIWASISPTTANTMHEKIFAQMFNHARVVTQGTITLSKSQTVDFERMAQLGHVDLKCQNYDGPPSQVYLMMEELGSGSFGAVFRGQHLVTKHFHAIKQLKKEEVNNSNLSAEIEIVRGLDHPHILRLYATFEDEECIYMATELCSGGEFFQIIEEIGYVPERPASRLFRQMLSAINYLHNKCICHRDLKPENFLVLHKAAPDQLIVKLIDFGCAKKFDSEVLVTKVCTAHYVAPEVLKRGDVPYTEKVDVWSCGVMLYMMLCGFFPFHHNNNVELLKIIKKGKFEFKPVAAWALISDDAKDLIGKMLTIDPAGRYSAGQAYYHRWTSRSSYGAEGGFSEAMMMQMRKYTMHNSLKRVALQIMARQIQDESIDKLREVFVSCDTDNSGSLTLEEMGQALKRLKLGEEAQQEMTEIMKALDHDDRGEIEYTEFIAACLTKEQYSQEADCRAAFHILDLDGDGELTETDLTLLLENGEFGKLGLTSTGLEEIRRILKMHDADADGGIDFNEFLQLMGDDADDLRTMMVMRPVTSRRSSTSRPGQSEMDNL